MSRTVEPHLVNAARVLEELLGELYPGHRWIVTVKPREQEPDA